MCFGPSTIVRYAYNLLVFAGLVLTLVALFSPQWRKFTINYQDPVNLQNVQKAVDFGLNLVQCASSWDSFLNCVNFTNGTEYQKATIGLLFVGAGSSAVALVWSIVTACCLCCCCCGCQTCFTWPFVILSLIASVADAIAIGIFALKSGEKIPDITTTFTAQLNSQTAFGYAMWLGVAAIASLTLSTVMAIFLLRMNKVVPT